VNLPILLSCGFVSFIAYNIGHLSVALIKGVDIMDLTNVTWGSPRHTTLVDNGNSDNRLDVAIIGDGYTAEQQEMFRQDAQEIVDAFRRIEPMSTYINHFNFHRVDVISPESGAIDTYLDPPKRPNSALHTFFSPLNERRLIGPDPWVMLVVTESGAPWDKILVVVNTERRGAATLATMSVAYASRNSSEYPRIIIHEAGHTIAGLIDEYTGELPDIEFAKGWSVPNFLPWPNVDTNAKRPKWRRWLSPGVELPTPDTPENRKKVGAFEGATYTNFGVYRPQRRCMMRVHSADFCAVCREQWIKAIYKRSKIADSFSPEFNLPRPPLRIKPGQTVSFSAQLVRRQGITTRWRTRKPEHARWRLRQKTEDYADFSVQLPRSTVFGMKVPTLWWVECTLEDGSDRVRTPSIRRISRQRQVWHVIVA